MSLCAACPGALAVTAGTPLSLSAAAPGKRWGHGAFPRLLGREAQGSACRGPGLEGSGPAQKEQGLPV